MKIETHNHSSFYKTTFNGFKDARTASLVVLDMDRALSHATPECAAKISEYLKSLKSKVIYLSKLKFENIKELQDFFQVKDLDLPVADFLVGDGADNVKSNFGGVYLGNYGFKEKLRKDTNYNASWINNIIKSRIDIGEYNFSAEEIAKLKATGEYFNIAYFDPNFANAKISPLKNQDEFRNEFFISPDINPYEFGDKIIELLKSRGIRAVYKVAKYPEKFLSKMDKDAQMKAHTLRRNPDNSITSVVFSPVGKGESIKYIRDSLGINPDEVFIASTDRRDIGLAKISNQGAMFVCLQNAQPNLKKYCSDNLNENIYISKKSGADGILEGIEHFKSSSDLPF